MYILIKFKFFKLQLVELVASEEAKMGNAEICVAERKILMKKLKASMEDNFENFNALKNITYMWESIENTAIEVPLTSHSFLIVNKK